MIIDTHTHCYDPARPQGVPWPPPENKLLYRTVLPEHYRVLAEPAGVVGTVVVEASPWLEDNQWVLDLATEEPFIVGLVGNIEPNRKEFGAELERFAANPLFRGIRCRGQHFDDVGKGSFVEDMARLAAKDLELDVLVHSQHFDGLVKLAEMVPELRIVVDHIGHMPVDGKPLSPAWMEDYRRLGAQSNVYMKVSALMEFSTVRPVPVDVAFYRPTLDALWQAFGEDKLIFGSNWPVLERAGGFVPALDIVKAYFAEKGQEASEKYFWRNAKTVYKWIER